VSRGRQPAAPRRIGRRIVYEGRVFRVELDRVRVAPDRVLKMEVVRHPGSVVLIPQPSRDDVILIRQYRYVIRRWIWELPAGSLEPGERADHAARRECEEEIGLTPGRIRRLGTLYPTPGFCDEKMVFYRCDRLKPLSRPVAKDEDEQIEPRRFSIDAAWRLVARRQIVDMKTIVGLTLLDRVNAGQRAKGRGQRQGEREKVRGGRPED
jgi:ADP-ribose diphosphatase